MLVRQQHAFDRKIVPKSQKPAVIERIFDQLYDPATRTLKRTMVTKEDVNEAIRWCAANRGISLSDENPANFIKDVVRAIGASNMWPDRLKELRWTCRQAPGDGNCFEFVPYADGQTEAFPTPFKYHPGAPRHRVQTLSIPVASKALGRNDETYLIQVAVKLGIVETHLALHSPIRMQELSHLQTGIKLRKTEIDALFAATYVDADGTAKQLAITCEAKRKGQRILEEQVARQVRAAFKTMPAVDLVVPIAMAAEKGGVYIVEFKSVARSALNDFEDLELESDGFYELCPPLKGI